MKNMIDALRDYILYLQGEHSLYVTVHSFSDELCEVTRALSELNIHSNPYCIYIKSFSDVWNNCISRQKKVYEYIKKNGDEIFFGSCYAGVGEYVVPVCENDIIYGFISVSGYAGSSEKMRHIREKYTLPRETLEQNYCKYLCNTVPDKKTIETLIIPVRAMLLVQIREKPANLYSEEETIVNNALACLHRNYAAKIDLDFVADYCHCSRRTLTSKFSKVTGYTVGHYIDKLRMQKAASLLADTSLKITEIAFLCGFSDANYFSRRYSEYYNINPSGYKTGILGQNPDKSAETYQKSYFVE